MKIVVIGGSGLIGSKLVEKLREAGNDPLPASPDSGVDTLTGEGLQEALEGAQVVVDVSNAPAWDDAAVMDFFQTSSRNILAAETAAGVSHHVTLSVVGTDRLQDSGYFRAKLAQEEVVKAGSVPYTILRATQFFEFLGRIADSSTDGDTVRLAPVFVQPESADDVAAALAEIAVNQPVNGIVELAGPDQFRLDELAERVLRAKNDPRHVRADMRARYFGAELDHYSLTPENNVRIAPTRFEDWLSQSTTGQTNVATRKDPRMSTDVTTPDTIVLIHGFWVTPRSWEDWKARYESRGYRVLTPAYPGFEVEVEALNAEPTPIEELTVPAVIEHLESVVRELDAPPILMGHSAGGVFTQLLMDRGYGAAGVAINSAPTEGVKRVPLSQIRSSFPVLKNPANRHKAVGFTFKQWRYVFTNTFSEEEARRLYERYHIPASGRVFWGSALANIHPGPDDTHVDYKNPNRAPLLFISGSEDHLMPPSIQRSNAKHYKAEGTITEVVEYEGRAHLMPSQTGWEEIADYALSWATEQATVWAARRRLEARA